MLCSAPDNEEGEREADQHCTLYQGELMLIMEDQFSHFVVFCGRLKYFIISLNNCYYKLRWMNLMFICNNISERWKRKQFDIITISPSLET